MRKTVEIKVENNTTGVERTYKTASKEFGLGWNYHHNDTLLLIFQHTGNAEKDWYPLAQLKNHSIVEFKQVEVPNDK